MLTDRDARHSPRAYPVQVLDRAFAILEFLAERPARLPEISRGVGLHRATVFRLLANLEAKGYVRRVGALGPFALGARTFQLGARAFAAEYPAHRLRPLLAALAERTHLTAQVWIRVGDQAVCIDQCDSPADLRVTSRVGRALPLNTASAGKVLLAYAPAEVRDRILAGPLPALSERTTTDPGALRLELEEIRARGFGFAVGEVSPVTAGLAAPVFDGRAEIAAAINLLGMAPDMTPAATERFLPMLLETARAMESELGPVAP